MRSVPRAMVSFFHSGPRPAGEGGVKDSSRSPPRWGPVSPALLVSQLRGRTRRPPVREAPGERHTMTTLSRPPADPSAPRPGRKTALRKWLLVGLQDSKGHHQGPHGVRTEDEKKHSWWQVMCLTGVDYFSTLGYQPAIAALAAGVISPLATLVLVALTLLGALPVYRRVARESFRGSGSIAMLERLLPWWAGKLFVLILLGFAATDFMITITLPAADATAHAVENPRLEPFLSGHQIVITLILLALLAGVFLRGFKEAIGVAVILVAIY